MGGGVVKGLTLKGVASLCMSWCGYEMVMLHFKQNISRHNVIIQAMCFHQWFWCLQWILHYIYIYCCIHYHVYITMYILHTPLICFWFVYNCLCFSKNVYLILNRHECNFQLQILRFLKSVLHPFMLFTSVFHNRTCPDWTCTSSKDRLTTIESRPFPGIIYSLP